VTPRTLARLLAAHALVVAAASAAVVAWLAPGARPEAGREEIASAWRGGARVGRRVAAAGDGARALAADPGARADSPGTTLVVERVLGDGRVVTLTRGLFARSFVPGRDGVRVTLDGRDAYLTPDELLAEGLYTPAGVDAERALARLAAELGVTAEALWRGGRFRRFPAARLPPVTAGGPPDGDPMRRAHGDVTASPARLRLAVEEAAHYLERQLGADGRFAGARVAAAGAATAYDWRAHAAATLFLADAGDVLGRYELRSAARRAAWPLKEGARPSCGGASCIGDPGSPAVGRGEPGDTAVSAAALAAFGEIAREKAGMAFLAPAAALAVFLRGQQRADGGFSPAWDPARQRPAAGEDPATDAAATVALARAYRANHDPANRDAARRGMAHLIRRPGLIGARDYLDADARICDALDDLGDRPPDTGPLAFCQRWTSFGRLLQVDRAGPLPELGGGSRAGIAWTPDVLVTAARSEGAVATIASALRAGQSAESLRALDVQMAGGIQLLLRDQLPGTRGHLLRDAAAATGGFTASPVDLEARLDATAAAGAAMVRCLRAIEARAPSSRRRR